MKKWKTIKSKMAYDCKYFKVLEKDFVLPSGKNHRYYILDVKDYVIVIAKKEDCFYLVEQYRYTTRSKLLQVVAGAIERRETPIQSASKELEEEAGITAGKFIKLGWFYSFYGSSNQKAYVFLAEDLKFSKQKPDELEKEAGIKVVKLKISEVKNLIKSGKIKDHDTLSAFSLYVLKCE